MGNQYSDLYPQYKKNILSLMNTDEFYENMLESVEQGKNNLSLFNRYLEKKIDLVWVDAIEQCIVPLDNIVRNPRKFIVQEEEIVPIERAKKDNGGVCTPPCTAYKYDCARGRRPCDAKLYPKRFP